MKLLWQAGTGKESYVADGEEYSYRVSFIPVTREWVVTKMRQAGGQTVKLFSCLTLEGAFARAQTWENDGQKG